MKKTLLHICCGPCLLGPLDELLTPASAGDTGDTPGNAGDQPTAFTGYFYNPNIHGLIEFRRRLKGVKLLADRRRFNLIADEAYGLNDFLNSVAWQQSPADRCRSCYHMRLLRTAQTARELGFDAFTTTMLVSRHQQHQTLRELGEEIGRTVGVEFQYHDWRHLAQAGLDNASRLNVYRQSYCGCIFSEQQRYENTRLHCYKGDSGGISPAGPAKG